MRLLAQSLARQGFRVHFIGTLIAPEGEWAQSEKELLHAIKVAADTTDVVERPNEVIYNWNGVRCVATSQSRIVPVTNEVLRKSSCSKKTLITAFEDSGPLVECAKCNDALAIAWVHSVSARSTNVLMSNPNRILATSKYVKQFLHQEFGAKSYLFYPPFILPRQFIFDGPRNYVTMVNPIPSKGLSTLVELCEKFPRLKFLAVEAWFPNQELHGNPPPNLRILPQQQSMSHVWSQTLVLLVPSLAPEGFGRVVVEAGLHGVPSLVSDSGGLPETVADPRSIVAKDTEAWAEALKNLLDNPITETHRKGLVEHYSQFAKDPATRLIDQGILSPSKN